MQIIKKKTIPRASANFGCGISKCTVLFDHSAPAMNAKYQNASVSYAPVINLSHSQVDTGKNCNVEQGLLQSYHISEMH